MVWGETIPRNQTQYEKHLVTKTPRNCVLREFAEPVLCRGEGVNRLRAAELCLDNDYPVSI